MTWSKQDIINHVKCCKLLDVIKTDAFNFISKNNNVTEYDVQQFILKKFKEHNLKTTFKPIVAFNASGANPHYFPKKKSAKLSKNTLILIDIWAAFDNIRSPYSDITWMGYTGKLTPEMLKVYKIVFLARDKCVDYLRNKLKEGIIPTGKELDAIARGVIDKAGYGKYFIHSTGHSIGYTSPHGIYGRLRKTGNKPLLLNMGYTIEPGIYLKRKFGVRTEIDFYITKDLKLIITTPVQKELIRV